MIPPSTPQGQDTGDIPAGRGGCAHSPGVQVVNPRCFQAQQETLPKAYGTPGPGVHPHTKQVLSSSHELAAEEATRKCLDQEGAQQLPLRVQPRAPHFLQQLPCTKPFPGCGPGENPWSLCKVTCGWHCHSQGNIEQKGNTKTVISGKLLISHSVFH